MVLLPRARAGGRRLFLLRVLFPSWRFFESIGVVPRLYVRASTVAGEWGDWTPALRPPSRGLWNLVLNPRGNLHFARQSAVEHLVSEAEGEIEAAGPDATAWTSTVAARIQDRPSYLIVQSIAEECVRFRGEHGAEPQHLISAFQFKIANVDDNGIEEDFLLSPSHALSGARPAGGRW